MKRLIEFIKTTAIGGLVVIIPMAILTVALGDTLKKLIKITQPLTENMPFSPLANSILAVLIVALVVIAIFFLAGLLLNTFWGKVAKNWIETKIFERIPMYSTVKGLTQRFAGIESSDFPVAEVDLYGSGSRVPGIVIEQLPDDRDLRSKQMFSFVMLLFTLVEPKATLAPLVTIPTN